MLTTIKSLFVEINQVELSSLSEFTGLLEKSTLKSIGPFLAGKTSLSQTFIEEVEETNLSEYDGSSVKL
jgi:hypothetical protein